MSVHSFSAEAWDWENLAAISSAHQLSPPLVHCLHLTASPFVFLGKSIPRAFWEWIYSWFITISSFLWHVQRGSFDLYGPFRIHHRAFQAKCTVFANDMLNKWEDFAKKVDGPAFSVPTRQILQERKFDRSELLWREQERKLVRGWWSDSANFVERASLAAISSEL